MPAASKEKKKKGKGQESQEGGQANGGLPATEAKSSSLAGSLFGSAVAADAGPVFSLPETWQPAQHQPKPAAKRTEQPSRRQLAVQRAAAAAAAPKAANDSDGSDEDANPSEDVNPGWKSLMAEEVAAGRGEGRSGKSAHQIRLERAGTAEQRTVFVGNLPLSFTKKKRLLKQLFKKCGDVESVRFRSFAVADLKMPRKGAFIKQNFNPARDTCNAYVVFKSDDPNVIASALALNNHKVEGRHIRVDKAGQRKADTKHSVFVGNLPFDVDEEALRTHFADECGIEGIVNVRIVRDPKTSLGKGIGFVELDTEAATAAALEVHGTKFNPKAESGGGEVRKLRVFKASAKAAAAAHKGGHERFGHSGTVGKPLANRPETYSRKESRGGAAGGGNSGAHLGAAQVTGGGDFPRGSVAAAPVWQGQTSAAGYVPVEVVGGRKRAREGGHSKQNKKGKRVKKGKQTK